MPRFDFECKKCKQIYEEMVSFDETGKYKTVKCPECGSKSKNKLMSAFGFAFGQPQGTGKWLNGATGHDYRFQHNLPKVRKERKDAEAASHVGPTPYKHIDDLNNDAVWGEVK